jgi:hypothetical protein
MAKGFKRRSNKDPLTGEKGAHPVGAAVGAAGGAVAGAAVGSLGGPVAGAVGATLGAVAGGLAGRGLAETVNPTVEDAHWRAHYRGAPYVDPDRHYEYYQPAYRFGWESYSQYGRRSFDEVEPSLARRWEARRHRSLGWDEARSAVRDAWEHASTRRAPDLPPAPSAERKAGE